MTNHTRYTIRLAVGIPLAVGFFVSSLELSRRSGVHDLDFWFWMVLTIILLALMVVAPRFFPPKFPSVSTSNQEIRPSDS